MTMKVKKESNIAPDNQYIDAHDINNNNNKLEQCFICCLCVRSRGCTVSVGIKTSS